MSDKAAAFEGRHREPGRDPMAMVESSRRSMDSFTAAASGPAMGGGAADVELAKQVRDLLNRAKGIETVVYDSPDQVIQAIEDKLMDKADAVKYAVKFHLVEEDKAEELTPKQALAMLKKASGGEDEIDELIAEEVKKKPVTVAKKAQAEEKKDEAAPGEATAINPADSKHTSEEVKAPEVKAQKEEAPKEEKKEEAPKEDKKEEKKDPPKDEKKEERRKIKRMRRKRIRSLGLKI